MMCHISTEVSFGVMFLITAAYFFVELTVGYVYKSLVLQADAYHMLSDVVSLVIGYIATKIASRAAVNEKGEIKNTFGWVRSEVVGALINSIFLVALCFTILIEALMKFADPEPTTSPLIVMGVAIGGLLFNMIGLFLFHDHAHGHKKTKQRSVIADTNNDSQEQANVGDDDTNNSFQLVEDNKAAQHLVEHNNDVHVVISDKHPSKDLVEEPEHSSQMNMKGVYLHILGDLLGSIIVIVNCVIIYFVKQSWVNYLDPVLSLLSVGILMFSTLPLAKKAIKILIQTVPKGYDIKTIQLDLREKFEDILDIHDFHLWQLVGSKYIASVHVKFKDFHSYTINSEQIKHYFHSIGIHSLTLQPEIYQESEIEHANITKSVCLLDCPSGSDCKPKQCC